MIREVQESRKKRPCVSTHATRWSGCISNPGLTGLQRLCKPWILYPRILNTVLSSGSSSYIPKFRRVAKRFTKRLSVESTAPLAPLKAVICRIADWTPFWLQNKVSLSRWFLTIQPQLILKNSILWCNCWPSKISSRLRLLPKSDDWEKNIMRMVTLLTSSSIFFITYSVLWCVQKNDY